MGVVSKLGVKNALGKQVGAANTPLPVALHPSFAAGTHSAITVGLTAPKIGTS